MPRRLVLNGKLDANDVSVIFSEKQQIIKKSGLLEYYEASEDFSQVAGLDNLKQWLVEAEHRLYRPGRPLRAVAAAGGDAPGRAGLRQEPLRQGRGQLVEPALAAVRRGADVQQPGRVPAKKTSAARSRPPKALPRSSSGSTRSTRRWPAPPASAGSDGGTSTRVFGTLLTWLSEKTSPVFVICTANEIAHLPPELLRKGRLDEIFFVDLPSENERMEILRIHLKKRGAIRQVRPGSAGPRQRGLQRRGDRGGGHLGAVRCLQRASGTFDRADPKDAGRDGAACRKP